MWESVALSVKGAQTIVDAIVAQAIKKGQAVSIAIVDEGGNMPAFKRMDELWRRYESRGKLTNHGVLGEKLRIRCPTQINSYLLFANNSRHGSTVTTHRLIARPSANFSSVRLPPVRPSLSGYKLAVTFVPTTRFFLV